MNTTTPSPTITTEVVTRIEVPFDSPGPICVDNVIPRAVEVRTITITAEPEQRTDTLWVTQYALDFLADPTTDSLRRLGGAARERRIEIALTGYKVTARLSRLHSGGPIHDVSPYVVHDARVLPR